MYLLNYFQFSSERGFVSPDSLAFEISESGEQPCRYEYRVSDCEAGRRVCYTRKETSSVNISQKVNDTAYFFSTGITVLRVPEP